MNNQYEYGKGFIKKSRPLSEIREEALLNGLDTTPIDFYFGTLYTDSQSEELQKLASQIEKLINDSELHVSNKYKYFISCKKILDKLNSELDNLHDKLFISYLGFYIGILALFLSGFIFVIS